MSQKTDHWVYDVSRCSVIIPTYNRIDTLGRALDSVLAQSTPPGEVLVVDDGSTDDTAEFVARTYPHVILIRQENAGVSAARNAGIKQAGGEWIALLDSDDAWMPNKLALQMNALARAPGLRLCHTEEIWIRNGRRVNQMKKHQKSGGHLFDRSLQLCCISPSSAVLHRSLFDEYGLFDDALPACEDYDLWLRITAHEETVFVETPVTIKHGGHADQLSRAHWGMDRFRIYAIEKVLESGTLSTEQQGQAIGVLVEKLRIMIGGAEKRGNQAVVDTYAPKLGHWRDCLEAVCGD